MLHNQYFYYYQAPFQVLQIMHWRDRELKELERSISPSTVQVFYGKLRGIRPFDGFLYVLKRDDVRKEYKKRVHPFVHPFNTFISAYKSALTEDEQNYFKQFYARQNEDERFHNMNLRIQAKIIELEGGMLREWY